MRSIRGPLALAVCLLLWAAPAHSGAVVEPVQASGTPEGSADVPMGQAAPYEEAYDPLFDDPDEGVLADEVYDPFESGNRVILRFNQGIDRLLWSPLTSGYRFVVPESGRRAVRRAFENLNTPVYMVNHVLQARPLLAAETFGAFVVNSTFGMGGLLDAASAAGFERRAADFGQTLARAGVGAGPYLVVPVFGPANLRDGFGWVVDRAFHPATYFLGIPIQLIWRGGVGVAEREAAADALEALEESSIDFYSVLRSAYSQSRDRAIAGKSEKSEPSPDDASASSL